MRYFDTETVSKLAGIGFKPSGLVEGNLVGNHRSPFHGFAIEFAGHRGYVPGDEIKHLDWTAYYKTGKYFLKQYEQETNFLAHIVVDVSESMGFSYKHGSKLDYALFMATSIAQIIVSQSDKVGFYFFADGIVDEIPVTGGIDIAARIAGTVEGMPAPKAKESIGESLRLVAERIGRRRVVFLISDFFADPDNTLDGIKRLIDAKHEVVLLHIVDPIELNFAVDGRVELVELEGEERLKLTANQIRESYGEVFHSFLEELRGRSLRLGAEYILCDMSRSFGFHLAEYFSARQRES